jgi:hypothetical protein
MPTPKILAAFVAALLLTACQQPKSPQPPLAGDWGSPDHGLQCRLYLKRTPDQEISDRDALFFQIKNISDHDIAIPVNQWSAPQDVPALAIAVVGFPQAQSGPGHGSAPDVLLHHLAPGELFTYRVATDYGIAARRRAACLTRTVKCKCAMLSGAYRFSFAHQLVAMPLSMFGWGPRASLPSPRPAQTATLSTPEHAGRIASHPHPRSRLILCSKPRSD